MPNQTPRAIPIGTIIDGKYRVERHVGDGGMGLVVAARHLVLNELYAIKFMHQRDLANPQAATRFIREAQAVVKLKNNEHVARVHDVGKHESGDLYIVMELLEGQDLGNVLKVRGVLPIHEACSYVLQACNALAEAHDLGIIHRDLKPANLFLTHRKDGSSCIKVLDFGISKILAGGGPESDVEMTGTREMMGSPLYMSPEQARSARDVDGRTDIWALGAILYKLLTGKAPFPGQTLAEVSFALAEPASVRPPSEIRRDIPRPLEACILRCLEKNVSRRYGRVTDLMVALAPFASKQTAIAEDDDNAATVLRPMAATRTNEAFGGGTLPLGAAHLGPLQSATSEPRYERSGTDVMPAYRRAAARDDLPSALNTNTTQPLDARALQALSDERRTKSKSSFTERVMLPPVSNSTSNPHSVPAPQPHPTNSATISGGMNGPQSAPARITASVPRLAIMPPPIPPAYPTGGYPIAPAARVTLPSSASVPLPDFTEPPWNRTQSKKAISNQRRWVALIAVVTIVVGAPIVLLAKWRLTPAHSAASNAAPFTSAKTSNAAAALPVPKASDPIPSPSASARSDQPLTPKALPGPSNKDFTPTVKKPTAIHE